MISIFLMLQVIPAGDAMIAERYTYISYIGLCYIAGQWLSKIWTSNRTSIAIGACAMLILFCSMAAARVSAWKNDYTLYADIIEKNEGNPYCFYPYFVLGTDKYVDGNHADALDDLNSSILLNPHYAAAWYIRGLAHFQMNDLPGAMTDFDQTIKLDPGNAPAYHNRASLKAEMHDFVGAFSDYNSLLRLSPNDGRAYADRGMVRLNLEDDAGACQDFRMSVKYGNYEAAKLLTLYCH